MLLPGLAGGHHTALGIRLKQLLYIRSTVHKLMRTELESFVLGQIHECDQQPAGVGPVH